MNKAAIQSALHEAYLKDIARCNPQQLQVVEATEGPMFVVSGPGTGKTSMVTLRIARLLQNPDIKPENVLCFSFTNAACSELRTRLEKRIGGIAAHKVGIYTFHAFANEVLMQHIDYMGIKNPKTITELEKTEAVKALIDRLPTTNPLRRLRGDEYFEVNRIIWLSQVIREEGWSVEYLMGEINAFVDALPTLPEYQYKRKYTDKTTGKTYLPGDANPKKVEEAKRYMEFTAAAVAALPTLWNEITAQGYYDYADMISWATGILAENEGLRRFIQEKYQYIIVDEFQDTSGSQLRLLELLLEYWMPDANVLMVGDPDQMIMGFQGAHAHSQEVFLQQFSPYLTTVVMDSNYRSTPSVLQAAHDCILQNESYGRISPLSSANPSVAKGNDIKPVVRAYQNPVSELAHIASELKTMMHTGQDLSEVFCLFPKHRLYDHFILALDGFGIPYQVQRPIDVLTHRTARMVLALFEYIAIECDRYKQGEGEHLLFEALHYPFIGVSHADASRITRYIWNHAKPRPSWFDVITSPDHLQAAGVANPDGVLKAGSLVGGMMAQAFAKGSALEIYRGILDAGLMTWAVTQPDALLHLDVLNSLHRFIDEQTARKPYLTCADLCNIIADMQHNNLRLTISRTSGTSDGVRIMTLHAAKGMEADVVYMIGCRKDIMDDEGGSSARQYKLPPNVIRAAFDAGGEEERRKLFYVGMTRARRKLIMSYSQNDDAGKDKTKSAFAAEVLGHGSADEYIMDVQEADLVRYQAALLTTVQPSADMGQTLSDEELDDMLQGYRLSPTHLNIYLRCGAEFYLNYVLRVPRVKNLFAAFGTAIDGALRELHHVVSAKALAKKMDKETAIDKKGMYDEMLRAKYGVDYAKILSETSEYDAMMDTFVAEMNRQRGYFPSLVSFENKLAYGKQELDVFYAHYRPIQPTVCQPGYSFATVYMEGAALTGEIDNLVWTEKDEVRVEDWKTGNALKGMAKAKNTKVFNEAFTPELVADPDAMGEYRRQLYFYRLLLKHHPTLLLKPVSGAVRFIESSQTGGEPKHVSIDFDQQEESLVAAQIKYAYSGILNKQFSKMCNDPLCRSCAFVKETGIILPGSK